jgi:cobalt-zinc-cadmium resistance protein CzcA
MQLQKEQWKIQKQGLYPEISLNYANMTIVGWQKINGEDRYFNSGYRFGMAGLGLKMPLWYKPYISGVNAAKIQYIAARYTYDYDMFSVKNHIQLAAQEVKQMQNQVDGYKRYAVISSDSVLLLAKLQLQKGNIGFLEWMLLLGSVQQTMENYYQAQQRCNEAWFRFEYLINK